VHGNVDLRVEQRNVNLFREEAFATNVCQWLIEDLIACITLNSSNRMHRTRTGHLPDQSLPEKSLMFDGLQHGW
jgi:hypothetical protein